MTQFAFLNAEFLAVFESASKAESLAVTDPRTACFYARRTLELAMSWAFKFDSGLKLPYQDNISARLLPCLAGFLLSDLQQQRKPPCE